MTSPILLVCVLIIGTAYCQVPGLDVSAAGVGAQPEMGNVGAEVASAVAPMVGSIAENAMAATEAVADATAPAVQPEPAAAPSYG